MKKNLFTVLTALLVFTNCFSQDIITQKSGEDIKAKILEVTQTEVKYKKFDNQTGPSFSMMKSEILMIRYENGTKDIFKETTSPTTTDLYTQGQSDSKLNYRGKNSGAVWTSVTTLLTSPVLGLIPAVLCASNEPLDENLNITKPELMKDANYNKGYREQAHKTKKNKVWTNYGISSGAWLLIILLL